MASLLLAHFTTQLVIFKNITHILVR